MENRPVAAILVDYDYYKKSPAVQKFVEARRNKASLVALVGSPEAQTISDDEDWNVVIENFKGAPDDEFKFHCLEALSRYSNLYPAISIDEFNEDIYDEAGTLIHLGDDYFNVEH